MTKQPYLVALVCSVLTSAIAYPQAVQSGKGGEAGRSFLAVPMIGSGTWADPKRPAFVTEAGVAFQYQASDDGTMALVQVTARNVLEMSKLEETLKKEPRAKVFRAGRDKLADVSAEFKKLKRDFDTDGFAKSGTLTPAPGPEPGK